VPERVGGITSMRSGTPGGASACGCGREEDAQAETKNSAAAAAAAAVAAVAAITKRGGTRRVLGRSHCHGITSVVQAKRCTPAC